MGIKLAVGIKVKELSDIKKKIMALFDRNRNQILLFNNDYFMSYYLKKQEKK